MELRRNYSEEQKSLTKMDTSVGCAMRYNDLSTVIEEVFLMVFQSLSLLRRSIRESPRGCGGSKHQQNIDFTTLDLRYSYAVGIGELSHDLSPIRLFRG